PQSVYRTISAERIDSACVGNTSDAVCALETLLACTTLGRPELCEKVGLSGMPAFPPRGVTEYRIVTVRSVMSEPIAPELRQKSWYRKGTMVVRLGVRYCESSCDSDDFLFELYIMEPHTDGFHLAGMTTGVQPACEEPDPDQPECRHYLGYVGRYMI